MKREHSALPPMLEASVLLGLQGAVILKPNGVRKAFHKYPSTSITNKAKTKMQMQEKNFSNSPPYLVLVGSLLPNNEIIE